MACLREMAAEGQTVMFSSHTLSEVETLCDHIAIVRDGRIVEDSTLTALKAQAPRQILITLRPDQVAGSIMWPDHVSVRYVPGTTGSAAVSPAALIAPAVRDRTCILELLGTSAPFMKWAAEQDFSDITIGAPALEVLFRRYYDTATTPNPEAA